MFLRRRSTLGSRNVTGALHTPRSRGVIAACPAQEVWYTDARTYMAATSRTCCSARPTTPSRASPRAFGHLLTKTALGVFGCVPAFDRYFRKGFQVSRFGIPSLERLRDLYEL